MGNKNHPLEDVFNIEQGSTPSDHLPLAVEDESDDETLPLISDSVDDSSSSKKYGMAEYDSKDIDIDNKFTNIHNAAMSAYNAQIADADLVEGKYKARAQEVAIQALKVALDATESKAKLKIDKEKVRVSAEKVVRDAENAANANTIRGDRNELLRMIKEQNDKGSELGVIEKE